MVNFKVVISDKTGKSLSHELKDKDAQPFLGSKIGDTFDSSLVGLSGGKLQITDYIIIITISIIWTRLWNFSILKSLNNYLYDRGGAIVIILYNNTGY